MFVLKMSLRRRAVFGVVVWHAGQEIDLVSSWVPEPNWKIPVLHE